MVVMCNRSVSSNRSVSNGCIVNNVSSGVSDISIVSKKKKTLTVIFLVCVRIDLKPHISYLKEALANTNPVSTYFIVFWCILYSQGIQ